MSPELKKTEDNSGPKKSEGSFVDTISDHIESPVETDDSSTSPTAAHTHPHTEPVDREGIISAATGYFKARVNRIEGVDSVYRQVEQGDISFWTVVNDYSRNKRDEIYEVEFETMLEFDELMVDFSVISADKDPEFSQIPKNSIRVL